MTDENEFFEARRQKLQGEVRRAVLDLLQHMGNPAAMFLQLDPNTPDLIVVAGLRANVARWASEAQ